MSELTQQMVDQVARELVERGLTIEAGFAGYKLIFKIPLEHEADTRRAFFAGAQHLFASIMNNALEEGAEPTEGDMRRMDNIARELKEFEAVLEEAVRKMGN